MAWDCVSLNASTTGIASACIGIEVRLTAPKETNNMAPIMYEAAPPPPRFLRSPYL